jgi:hypothetical protein
MDKVFDDLIDAWLNSYKIDMNITEKQLDVSMDIDEDVPIEKKTKSIPYFLPEVTRMAFLLKRRCTKELAEKIKALEVSNLFIFN